MLSHSNTSYTATCDITVYKVFKAIGYKNWFSETEGRIFHPNQTLTLCNDSLLWDDFDGIQTYESEKEAKKRAKYLSDKTHHRYIVIECVIPKNTHYFIGTGTDIGDVILFSSDILTVRKHESWFENFIDWWHS